MIPTGTIETYLEQQLKLEKIAGMPEQLQEMQAKITTAAHKALNVIGIHPQPNDLGIGKRNTHILGETFFTMAALRYGDYVAKISAAPLSENVKVLADQEIDSENDSALKELVVDFFTGNSAEYELSVQLCTDLSIMPVEDGSVEWPQEQSPYLSVGKLIIPSQNAYSPERRVYADDVLTFNPFHCLPEHRPLGSIMRARRLAYETSSRYRHAMNAQPRVEPTTIDDLPE